MAYLGAPNLLSGVPSPAIAVLGSAVASLWNRLFPGAQWGIFDSGKTTRPVDVTSVLAINLRRESTLSDYRIESGSFSTYNKVERPMDIPIRITKEGNDLERGSLLSWLEFEIGNTSVFDIVTPEIRYPSMTLVGYNVQREATGGAGLVVVDCLFQEVRETTAVYTNTTKNAQDTPATPTSRTQTTSAPTNADSGVTWQ